MDDSRIYNSAEKGAISSVVLLNLSYFLLFCSHTGKRLKKDKTSRMVLSLIPFMVSQSECFNPKTKCI